MNHFLAELERCNVIRAVGLYRAGAWLLVQVVGTVFLRGPGKAPGQPAAIPFDVTLVSTGGQ